jgi:uncharacterized membrane protein YbhN (UPF0104 family)
MSTVVKAIEVYLYLMKRSRLALSILVLVGTVGLFTYYLAKHPSTLHQLTHLRVSYALPILLLYLAFTVFLSIAVKASVKLCDKDLDMAESFKLTASSALANFFGPLQSGPGVRALYLKKKHGIPIKKYSLATFYYYGFYAIFSGLFLLSGNASWRLPLLGILVVSTGVIIVLLRSKQRRSKEVSSLKLTYLLQLAVATFLQLSCTVLIYWIELSSIGVHASVSQVLSYSGAANFALFVSLTPGAIGFREAFLVFSRNLHHIGNSAIVAANVIDRAMYIIFLALLFLWLGLTHTKKQIDLGKLGSIKS